MGMLLKCRGQTDRSVDVDVCRSGACSNGAYNLENEFELYFN